MAVNRLHVDILIRGVCKKCRSELIRMMDVDLWLEGLGEDEESNAYSERVLLEGHLCLPGELPGVENCEAAA